MAKQITPESKADIHERFEKQLRALQSHADVQMTAMRFATQRRWFVPDLNGDGITWTGDLFDWNGMHEPFNRDALNDMFTEATKDPQAPGTTGDLVLTTTQIEYLSVMERAYRARHTMRTPRTMLLAAGRLRGHSNSKGTFIQGVLEYVRGVSRMAKS